MSEKRLLNQESDGFEKREGYFGRRQRGKRKAKSKPEEKIDQKQIYGLPFPVWLKVLIVNIIITVFAIAVYYFWACLIELQS